MAEFKFKYQGNHTDFDQWEWNEDDLLNDLLATILAKRMAVIFSDNGATVDISTPLSNGATGSLVLEVDVNVDQSNSLATISVPLSDLIVDYARYAGTGWRKSASLALRDIAETIDTLTDCPDDGQAIWVAARRDEDSPNVKDHLMTDSEAGGKSGAS